MFSIHLCAVHSKKKNTSNTHTTFLVEAGAAAEIQTEHLENKSLKRNW